MDVGQQDSAQCQLCRRSLRANDARQPHTRPTFDTIVLEVPSPPYGSWRNLKLVCCSGNRQAVSQKLPKEVHALAANLEEPYATLVLFLAASGLRIGEAIAIKPFDFEGSTLHIARRIYDGKVGPLKTKASIANCHWTRISSSVCAELAMRNGFFVRGQAQLSTRGMPGSDT
jgi:hypothetical protein